MNTVRVIVSPEDIVKNIKGLPQGGLILPTSIRAIGSTFEFQYHHPDIQHPFEVMELRAYLKQNAERGTQIAEVAKEEPASVVPAEAATPPMNEETMPAINPETGNPFTKKERKAFLDKLNKNAQ